MWRALIGQSRSAQRAEVFAAASDGTPILVSGQSTRLLKSNDTDPPDDRHHGQAISACPELSTQDTAPPPLPPWLGISRDEQGRQRRATRGREVSKLCNDKFSSSRTTTSAFLVPWSSPAKRRFPTTSPRSSWSLGVPAAYSSRFVRQQHVNVRLIAEVRRLFPVSLRLVPLTPSCAPTPRRSHRRG